MANEIQIQASLLVEKSNLKIQRDPGTQQVTMSGTRYVGGVQDIGTGAHEVLVVAAEFGTAGWAFFKNLDVTNYVEIGSDHTGTFVPFAKLKAGKAFPVPLSSDVIYAKANTGTVALEYTIVEE